MSQPALKEAPQTTSLVTKLAGRYGVEPSKMLATLKATAFKGEVSNEQLMALLIVADQYQLNPWTRELYAFPEKGGGIVPVVGVDGWARIINEHPQYDGVDFLWDDEGGWCECVIYRKDREHPTRIREYMMEVKRETQPWKSHPRRMLRHKALIQCARLAFGYAGIYDQDEAERIIEGERVDEPRKPAVARIKDALRKRESETVEAETNGPTFAEIAEKINKIDAATTAAEVDLCRDLVRGMKDEKQRDELDAMIDGRLKDLAAQAVGK